MASTNGPTARPLVFVSFASEDEKAGYTAELARALKAKATEGAFELWEYNERLKAGMKWDPSIQEALRRADVVVYLVSAAFLNSEYIRRAELLPGLAALDSGGKKVTAIHLHPADTDSTALTLRFKNAEGKLTKIRLSDSQWLHDPKKALTEVRSVPARQRLCNEIANRLAEVAQSVVTERRPKSKSAERESAVERRESRPSSQSSPRSPERPILWIKFDVENARLRRRYFTADLQKIEPADSICDLAETLQAYAAPFASHYDADRDDKEIFKALFDDPARLKQIIAAVHPSAKARGDSIEMCPLDVRIVPADDLTAAIPWRSASVHQRGKDSVQLTEQGWRFTLWNDASRSAPESHHSVTIRSPLRALAAIAGADVPQTPMAEFAADLRRWLHETRVGERSLGNVEFVRNKFELREACSTQAADVLLVLGDANGVGDRFRVQVGNEFLSLGDLAEMWGERPPSILCCGTSGPHAAVAGRGPRIWARPPGVAVFQPWSGANASLQDNARQLRGWLHRMLEDGMADPVESFCGPGSPLLPSAAMWPGFIAWRTELRPSQSKVGMARKELDRVMLKNAAKGRIDALTSDRERGAVCLVALAEAGSAYDEMWAGVCGELKQKAAGMKRTVLKDIQVKAAWVALGPEHRSRAVETMRQDVRRILHVDPAVRIRARLEAKHWDEKASRGTTQILAIGWRLPDDRTRNFGALAEWVKVWGGLCRTEFGRMSDRKLKILNCLIFEVDGGDFDAIHAEFVAAMDELGKDEDGGCPIDLHFGDEKLLKAHLRDFLRRSEFCSCPPASVNDICEILFKLSGGRFRELVELIDTAEAAVDGWTDLLRRRSGDASSSAGANP